MRRLVKFYVTLLVIFALAKVAFMAVHGNFGEIFRVLMHGLPLDLATAGYLSIPMWLSCFLRGKSRTFDIIYSAILAILLSLIFVGDTCLYSFWGFKIDSTIFTYLDKPEGAWNSVSGGYIALALTGWILSGAAIFSLLYFSLKSSVLMRHSNRISRTILLVFIGGLLFLAIRGGVGRSTANVGMVYYSENEYFNHSAVNPAFSLFSSWLKSQKLGKDAHFYKEDECKSLIDSLLPKKSYNQPMLQIVDSLPSRIVWIVMEGCGMKMFDTEGILPNLRQLASESVLFTNCYANSFRTDRGVLCSLSGYLSFPDVSPMKMPAKSRALPSVANSLKSIGYSREFLYGGDKNFTNMNSYLLSTGYQKTYGDEEFTLEERHTNAWGVNDEIVLSRAITLLEASPLPYFLTVLTLSSHEPWEVPYDRIKDDDKANSFAYLDACIGKFVAEIKRKGLWNNTLLILSSDHGIAWHGDMTWSHPEDWKIPVIFAGGVVKEPQRIDVICQQSDIATTLLGQLQVPHDDFKWSRNVLRTDYSPQFAYHTWASGIGYIDTTGVTVLSLPTYRVTNGTSDVNRERSMKALLQAGYGDFNEK